MGKLTTTRAQCYPLCLLHLLHSLGPAAAVSLESVAPKCPKNMSDILKAEGIVPSVIEVPPKHNVEVEFHPHSFVNFGNYLKLEIVQRKTFSIHWHHVVDECYSYFTLLMVGLDEPSRDFPIDEEFLYWLVVNIPNDSVAKGDCLAAYIPPDPEKGTGVHRYVYIVLHQSEGKLEFDEPYLNETTIDERKRWWTKAFMKNYGFKDIYAVNFFKSGWNTSSMTTNAPVTTMNGKTKTKKMTKYPTQI